LKILRMLRLLRLLKLAKFYILLSELTDQNNIHLSPSVVTLFNVFISLFFFTHFVACLFWAILSLETASCDQDLTHENAVIGDYFSDFCSGGAKAYDRAFSYALNILIGNTTRFDRLALDMFTTALTLVCLAVYTLLIGQATAAVSSMNRLAEMRKQKVEVARSFLTSQHIPHDLRRQITGYYKYIWDRHQAKAMTKEVPGVLSLKLDLALKHPLIKNAKLFSNLHNPEAVQALVSRLTQRIAIPYEIIVRQGLKGDSMYFLTDGECYVYYQDDNRTKYDTRSRKLPSLEDDLSGQYGKLVGILHEGESFGELSLFALDHHRSRTIITQCFCHLEVLSFENLVKTMQHYPDLEKVIMETAKGTHKKQQDLYKINSVYSFQPIRAKSHLAAPKIDSSSPWTWHRRLGHTL